MEILGYVAIVIMGVTLGLVGAGGSILTVPILVYLFRVDPLVATAYSLFIVGLTALIGGGMAYARGHVDLKTGALFAVPSFIGVYLTRAFVIPALPDPVLRFAEFSVGKGLLIMSVFAVLMIAASVSMIRPRKSGTGSTLTNSRHRTAIIFAEGLIVGAVTGFVGAGGGFLIIPALVMLVGLPIKIAVGTSLIIIATKSLLGFVGDIQSGLPIDTLFLLLLSAMATVGLVVGTILGRRVSDQNLKVGFGWFVLFMGLFVLIDQLL